MSDISIYTDGACSGNPGPGGWAAILVSSKHRKEISGRNFETTNNRMELLAFLEAVASIKQSGCRVVWYSDSLYAMRAIQRANKLNKNKDLIREAQRIITMKKIKLETVHVKGHSGHAENERCDQLAKEAIPR